ncbi:MAG: vWA domain-containing protein [Bdellovibrionales bacterium]
MNIKRMVQGLSTVTALIFVTVACSDVNLVARLDPPNSNGQSKGEFCIAEPTEVKPVTKVLFIVDKSYSNTLVILPDGGTLPGTDPGGSLRGGAIDRLVQNHAQDNWFQYSLVAFLDYEAIAYINDPQTRRPGFSANIQDAFNATQRLRNDDDYSETPFIEALQKGLEVVRNDRESHKDERANYVVMFLSDGIPTVGQSDKVIFDLVKQIKDVGGNLVFNSAFYGDYGDYTQNAKDRLAEMARIGGGKFIDFNKTTNWDLEDFFQKPTFEPWFLSRFMVYNLTAGYCLDGSIDTDSDMDGMCDKDEYSMSAHGFSSQNRFSFGDGYGDYFHWRRFKYRESLPPCNDRSDEDHDLLTACEERYVRNERPFPDFGKTGDPKQYDSDRDGMLDGIETFVFFTRSMAFALDGTNLTISFDGEEPSDYQITQHRNPLVVDKGALSYDSTVDPLIGTSLDCYSHKQQKLPLYPTLEVKAGNTLPGLEHGPQENPVLIYYIQKPQKTPRDDGVLRYSIQVLKNDPILRNVNQNAGLLKISDKVFSTYAPPLRQ